MSRLVLLILLVSTIVAVACEARTMPVHDYIFNVTGVVKTEDDAALQDAEVTLKLDGPVGKASTPGKTLTVKTDSLGRFTFNLFVSHERGVKYIVTVQKQGFEPATVSGSSPPRANHVIRLRRTAA